MGLGRLLKASRNLCHIALFKGLRWSEMSGIVLVKEVHLLARPWVYVVWVCVAAI